MKQIAQCLHGLKRELLPYRGVRLFEMNCGEVRCSLSDRDYFLPGFIQEWIDAALKGETDGWMALDLKALNKARSAPGSTEPKATGRTNL